MIRRTRHHRLLRRDHLLLIAGGGRGPDVGYSVTVTALRAAAGAAGRVAERATSIDLATAAGRIGTALPGGRTATAAAELARAWRDQIGHWAADAATHGWRLDRSADEYRTQELHAQQAFTRFPEPR